MARPRISPIPQGYRDAWFGVVALAAIAAVFVAGEVATYLNLEPWYASLKKPDYNPPNAVFPLAWTTLYILTGFALWRNLRLSRSPARRRALILFAVMLVLNAAWSWMFFAANSPVLGLVNIVPQVVVIVATIIACLPLDRLAALCLVPLGAWVGFATLLNYAIWRLNG
jgi:tryptophan-rich sensory protein